MGMHGAMIERGRIKEIQGKTYIVTSLDRDGIESPPIKTIYENARIMMIHHISDSSYTVTAQALIEEEYEVGQMVYFFLFPDGTGRILCGAE